MDEDLLDCAVEVDFMRTHKTGVCQRDDGVVSEFQLSAVVENLNSCWEGGAKDLRVFSRAPKLKATEIPE